MLIRPADRHQVTGAAVGLDQLVQVARGRAVDRASTSSTSAAISRNPIRPSRNACTATSFAALYAHGYVPPFSRLAREGEHAECVGVRLVELERLQLERRHRRRGALRVGERVGDRHAHVGVAECAIDGAVAEADEPVDDRRRVDHDLDPVVRRRRRGSAPR